MTQPRICSLAHLAQPMFVLLVCLLTSFPGAAQSAPAQLTYEILAEQAHDDRLFTQGLLMQDELLVESSGGYGKSLLRRYHAETGELEDQILLPKQIFAEGIAEADDKLYLLSWRERTCLVLDSRTLQQRGRHTYAGEGWGLTYDGTHLIMSDGSDTLTLRQPGTFTKVSSIKVHDENKSWRKLNELEFAQDLVWANVWQEDVVLAIAPDSGVVLGILDLSELVAHNSRRKGHSVLNGIAYDPARRAFWVTGKLWPRRYLISVSWPPTELSGGEPSDRDRGPGDESQELHESQQ